MLGFIAFSPTWRRAEKQIKSFSEELKQQLDEFGRQLEKPSPPEKQQPYRGTI